MVEKMTTYVQQVTQECQTTTDYRHTKVQWLKTNDLKALCGYYATPTHIVKVDMFGGYYVRTAWGSQWIRLASHGNGHFTAVVIVRGNITCPTRELDKLLFSFTTIDGRALLIVHEGATIRWAAEKIDMSTIPPAWKKSCGIYRAEEGNLPSPTYNLSIDHGVLILECPADAGKAAVRIPLVPKSDTEAIMIRLATGAGETITVMLAAGQESLRFGTTALTRVPPGAHQEKH